MKTYTNDEIVRALECCVECDTFDGECREDCPFKKADDCTFILGRETLDLIKRQQAEIEKQKKKLQEILPIVAELKSEAIKEFAERLKEKASSCVMSCNGQEMPETKSYTINALCIDELVKEMTVGGNAT